MLIIDEQFPTQAPRASVFMHGETGHGKSTFTCKGGNPLAVLTEPKAMAMLRKTNPDAIGFVPQSLREIRGILAMLGELHNPQGAAMERILKALLGEADHAKIPALQARMTRVDRIVLDSFTDLTYSLPQWMKDPEGREILHKMEIQEFGDLKNYALAVVKAIQLTGLPSFIIARSTVKKVGRTEKVVPDGYGKAIEELPGKCLPTVQSCRNDEGEYWIDSTPDECSQRVGLPWLPPVFKGTALEFLAVVEKGFNELPAGVVFVRPEIAAAAAAHFAEYSAEYSAPPSEPLPQRDMVTPIGEALQQVADAKRAQPQPVSQEASDFVDALTPAPQVAMATSEDAREVLDLALKHKVNTDQLLQYAASKGWAPGQKPNWMAITPEGVKTLVKFLSDDTKRRGLQAHLLSHFPLAKTA